MSKYRYPGVYIVEVTKDGSPITPFPGGGGGNGGGIILPEKINVTVVSSSGEEMFTDRVPARTASFLMTETGVWVPEKGTDDGRSIVKVSKDNRDVILHSGSTATGTGNVFEVGDANELKIKVKGTATTFEVVFEEGDEDGDYTPIFGVRRSDAKVSTKSTELNDVFIFDVSGAKTFRARLAVITGPSANIKVKGRVAK